MSCTADARGGVGDRENGVLRAERPKVLPQRSSNEASDRPVRPTNGAPSSCASDGSSASSEASGTDRPDDRGSSKRMDDAARERRTQRASHRGRHATGQPGGSPDDDTSENSRHSPTPLAAGSASVADKPR